MNQYKLIFSGFLFLTAPVVLAGARALPQVQHEARYQMTPMGHANSDKLIFLTKIDQFKEVPYLDATQRLKFLAVIKDGKFFDVNGVTFGKNGPTEEYIYVMDQFGNFFVSTRDVLQHHSSFFSAQPVAAAGLIYFNRGQLIRITNQSGHYQPTLKFFEQAVRELHLRGIAGFEVEVETWKDVELL